MTRKALIKKAELLRMADIAKEFGVMVWQEQDGVKVCVAPFHETGSLPFRKDRTQRATPDAPVPAFDRRERATMEFLASLGVDKPAHLNTIRNAGSATFKKLSDRGYVEIIHESGSPTSQDMVVLTKEGLFNWERLERYRRGE